ncbi:hypothetical protein AMBLS11_17255 [Alteromonas macleodii str. 'Black Sea 11']|uniref:DUF4112 domain-containing protein n=1 Tax=Alteromonas abrolhosensis TaxID=1892904 RepID=UPI000286F1C0|nr:DUF4112 domain-containing protein [Alteromonas abrolhosensis]AFT80018.1 hypothetical protein AMBLS11_17255 [Alteromonas macleodii str. 'Black Sea 11']NKW89337.1 DUF4112 domain-containing protein [Alteromonadaceae bacterium A_SAG4]NKX05475.1 DUF4112 domain-containing protein [Alteromonadaceae bacterium A_SAG6]NKX18992.1 DUF4112 domain-containing protein [Alteromonadaceae bacterium A_SAG5]NKX35368.1 DUF4112 domain-containing protein [Alteromonadaceae bacterium A_SAG3]NKX69220.1 DUF4112 domai
MEGKAPKALLKAQKLANLLDTAVKLPFIPIRIGLDSIVGLIPGAGDALMLFVSLRIVWLGKSLGMPKALIAQMVKNSAIDFGLGFIPFVGDIVDIFYKANQKNVRIIERWWISENKHEVDKATQKALSEWSAE